MGLLSSIVNRYLWLVKFSFFSSLFTRFRRLISHLDIIIVQNSNDKKCIDPNGNDAICLRHAIRFNKRNQFDFSVRANEKIRRRYRLFIVTSIIRDYVSVRAYTSIFYYRDTMELSVFYCTMHNPIEIFLLPRARSCREMTTMVSCIGSAHFSNSRQKIIALSVFISIRSN